MPIQRLLLLAVLGAMVAPAQFLVRVEQNGQAFTSSNGSVLGFNSTGVGQTSSAVVRVTYLGQTRATFASIPQLIGSKDFSTSALEPVSLRTSIPLQPLETLTFTLRYTPTTTEAAVGQFTWTYTEEPREGTTGPAISGAVAFTLTGTAPSLVVSSTLADANATPLASGATVTLPETLVNSNADVTISITNRGSGSGQVNAINLTGTGFQLLAVPLLPFTLTSGSELRFGVRFTPRTPGAATASLKITLDKTEHTTTIQGSALLSAFTYELLRDGVAAPLALNGLVAFGDVRVGERSSLVIQFRNVATLPAVINNILLGGTGFSITEGPFVPLTLQPQEVRTFTLNYVPVEPVTSTVRLLIGNDNFTVTGRGMGAQLRYSYAVGGVDVPITTNSVSFPPLSTGQTASVAFTVSNRGTAAGSVVSVGVLDTRGVFRLRSLPALPATVDPDGRFTFLVDFTPLVAGQATTTLVIDGTGFVLNGFSAAPPPLPSYQFTGASGVQQPFQQPSFGLSLNTTYPQALRGVLTLSITPDNFVTDPAVQFSTGGRTVAFTIPANTREAVFPSGANRLQLQTGTVAGAIVIEPTFVTENGTDLTPPTPTRLSLNIPRTAPVLLAARVSTRSATGLSINVTGYATGRSLTSLEFEFKGDETTTLGTAKFTVSVSAEALIWFQSAASQSLGGQFTVDVPFTLRLDGGTSTPTTDITARLKSVTVRAVSDLGPSNTLQVAIQ
ncbi:MAG: choice-of-anchor D domain-containing protein [Acidobacteria bacterium]|nr:choice-of-anchor D domain-containing protein [Acidobacteriota bacterium]